MSSPTRLGLRRRVVDAVQRNPVPAWVTAGAVVALFAGAMGAPAAMFSPIQLDRLSTPDRISTEDPRWIAVNIPAGASPRDFLGTFGLATDRATYLVSCKGPPTDDVAALEGHVGQLWVAVGLPAPTTLPEACRNDLGPY